MKSSRIMPFLLACLLFIVFAIIPMANAENTIKIGYIGVLTGPGAMYGIAVQKGMNLCINEVNAAGGINGRKVELISMDSQGNPAMGQQAYYKLVESEGVVAILGPVLTDVSKAVADAANDDGMPMITPSATAYEVTTDRPSVFRTCFLDPFQAAVIARYVAQEGIKSVGVLYDNGDEYSNGLMLAFKEECEKQGVNIVASESASFDDVDFKSQLTNLKNAGPEAVFLPYYGAPAALILTQANELGFSPRFFGADGISNVIDSISDKSLLTNIIYTDHFTGDAQSEKAIHYLKAFESEYGEKPTLAFSATAYDAALVLIEAIKSAGTTDKGAIVSAIKSSSVNGVTGNITFDEHNDPIKSVFFTTFDAEGNKVFIKQLDP